MKFIDLCAGIGGFHHALHQIGWQCVYASEINPKARKVYQHNFKDISPELFEDKLFNEDIYECDTVDIPDFDVICAGFPCQPFSQIGYKKGFTEDLEGRGNLFFELTRIIKDKQPKVLFLENVRHIVKHDEGRTFARIRDEIKELGYSFYWKVIRASEFGLPQHRPRTFMIGFKGEKDHDCYFEFPDAQELEMTMSDIFGGECDRDIGFTLRLGGMGSGIEDRRNWDAYRVNGEVVRLQVEHGKKMQGFPEEFQLPKARGTGLKLLGNSVATNVVREIGVQIEKYVTSKDDFKKGKQMRMGL
jgi:DNA (cytosine-5)-methyltransferase 1